MTKERLLHQQEVTLCVGQVGLHQQTLRTLAGLLELCGNEAVKADLARETGHLMRMEIDHMDAWMSRLEKVALGIEAQLHRKP